MGDAADILGINKSGDGTRKLEKSKMKKPEGLSREVYALTGGVPSMAPTLGPAGLKERRRLSTKKAVSWTHREFKNSARSDGLQLKHWEKTDIQLPDYHFAKFNKKMELETYNNEEYDKYFKDQEWTKAETDHLFELIRRYDGRFIVIADRFKYKRTVEELKHRYYTIATRLALLHHGEEEGNEKPICKFPYDKAYEVERKSQYEKLYQRTREEEKEEERLLQVAKRIEANLKKQSKEKRFRGDERREADLQQKLPPGPVLRSSIMFEGFPISSKKARNVEIVLEEAGVSLPPMPTERVMQAFTNLRHDIVTMYDSQRQVAKKEYEIQVYKNRDKSGMKGGLSRKRSSSGGMDTSGKKRK